MDKNNTLAVNMQKVFKLSLLLEDIQDDYNYVVKEIDKVFDKINEYREKKDALSDEELLTITNDIIKKSDKIIDLVGKDNYIFYDDGAINYIWSNNRNKNLKKEDSL